jgi:ATP adenylyltransferase
VLNRFPIIANHFILATVPFKPQDEPLDADDLAATHACLRAWEEEDAGPGGGDAGGAAPRRLIAFFNMGPASGASQPHRHVQFLPEEDVRAGMPAGDGDGDGGGGASSPSPPWRPLIDLLEPAAGPAEGKGGLAAPFVCYRAALPADPSPAELHAAYSGLLARADAAWNEAYVNLGLHAEARFSCNWAMVRGALAVCPRVAEAAGVDGAGAAGGHVGVNGTVLAGTVMVKRREEWDWLRGGGAALDRVLGEVAVSMEAWEKWNARKKGNM